MKNTLPKPAQLVAFTEAEEAFFRAGDEPTALAESIEDSETGHARPSLWQRLFSRTQNA